jgi:hypothetical protein
MTEKELNIKRVKRNNLVDSRDSFYTIVSMINVIKTTAYNIDYKNELFYCKTDILQIYA